MVKISFRKYVFFILLPLAAVIALLYYVASNSVDQFFEHETELAEASVVSTNTLIQQYIAGLRRNVGHYAHNYQSEIQRLVDNPQDELLHERVSQSVLMYFPNSAAFTIADSQGNVLLDDFDGIVGSSCRENIRLYSISGEQSDSHLRIHPNPLMYHFDIMHQMHATDGRVIIFFISFKPVNIANYLANLQLPGHQMMIIKENGDSLIEVTGDGSRVQLKRDAFLTNEEQGRVLSKIDIKNTLWQIVDIINENHIDKAKFLVYRDFGFIFASFLLGILLAIFVIMKHDKMRFHAESKLRNLLKK